jgi:hypothetical protein
MSAECEVLQELLSSYEKETNQGVSTPIAHKKPKRATSRRASARKPSAKTAKSDITTATKK